MLFGLFGRAIFVKPSRQRRPEPSATRKKFCKPIIFSSVKAPLFTPSAGRGVVVSDFGGNFPLNRASPKKSGEPPKKIGVGRGFLGEIGRAVLASAPTPIAKGESVPPSQAPV